MRNPSLALGLLTSALLATTNAGAAIIGVTFDNQTTTPDFDSTELAGAPGVRVANWNPWFKGDNILGDAGQTIVDDSGATVAGFQASINGAATSQRGTISVNDTQMFRGVQDISGSETYSITGVPYATYDVYAYMHDDSSTRAGSFTIGSTTYYVRGPGPSEGNGDPDTSGNGYILSTDTTVDLSSPNTTTVDDSIDQGNYVVFSGLTGSSFDLIAQAIDTSNGANRNKFAGFQIVQVPEPGSTALVMIGIGGLLLGRRRK